MSDRPPPTSYRDAHERFHPGPGCDGYLEHVGGCRPCRLHLHKAATAGESWARKYDAILEFTTAPILPNPPAPTYLPGPGEGALVPAPRSLPARWLRYAAPGPLAVGMAGGCALWLLPVSVQFPLVILLLVFVAAIRRYVPDLVPAARSVRR